MYIFWQILPKPILKIFFSLIKALSLLTELLFSSFVRGQSTPTFSNWSNFNGSEEIKKFYKRHFMHLTNFKFTRQLISFFRHQYFLLFSLLFVVSRGTLFSQGSVVTWGNSSYGGDSSSVSGIDSGVINIFSNERAFAALKSDGSVVTWGDSNYGGDSSSVSGIDSGVTEIFSTQKAFAALKSDGFLVAWAAD